MTRTERRMLSLAVALVTGLWVVPAGATNIVGSKLQAKPTIKFQFQSKDPAITPAGIDPIAAGATLTVQVNAVTLTFNMPGGAVCGGVNCWSGDAVAGWKYKNSAAPAAPGVVKIAQIKAGKMKVLTKGSSGDAGGAFPSPVATDVTVVMTVSGTMYCATFPLADATKNDTVRGYLNKNPNLVAGACAGATTTTTMATSTTTTTTTTIPLSCSDAQACPAYSTPGPCNTCCNAVPGCSNACLNATVFACTTPADNA